MTRRCPLCAAPAPPPFLRRDGVPVFQNRTEATAAAARAAPRGALAMTACAACGFVFNAAFDPALAQYGPGYDNAQAHSATFAAHLDALARHMVARRGVRGAAIVEIGCGQGGFLRRLLAEDAGNTGVGFDPAYAGPAIACDGRLRGVPALFGQDAAEPADVAVCRHVIEHVADPLALLRAIRAALDPSRPARLFLETPDAGWILRHAVPWDMFYEHCSLFTAATLAAACARAGLRVTEVRHVFGGQYLWLEAEAGVPEASGGDPTMAAQARRYAEAVALQLDAWRNRLAACGPVAVWGAGAKGATFASLVDPECEQVACLVDVNPAKQGRFVAGTGHPIVAPAWLGRRGVRCVVPMNPHYRDEIAAALPPQTDLAEWAA